MNYLKYSGSKEIKENSSESQNDYNSIPIGATKSCLSWTLFNELVSSTSLRNKICKCLNKSSAIFEFRFGKQMYNF